MLKEGERQLKKVILASNSHRRHGLLLQIGLEHVVLSVETEEIKKDMPPEDLVMANALAKASEVARLQPEALVIGSDTIVVLDELILGKPKDAAEAAVMLSYLSGRWHFVYTGLALVEKGREQVGWQVSKVLFKELSKENIAAYVATGEPMDKAGAYGIQDRGALLVSCIEGDYNNIVGLPLAKLEEMLANWGYDIWGMIT